MPHACGFFSCWCLKTAEQEKLLFLVQGTVQTPVLFKKSNLLGSLFGTTMEGCVSSVVVILRIKQLFKAPDNL